MIRYHINPKTGNPGQCKAKNTCPFGDIDIDHYLSKESARKAYEDSQGSFSAPLSYGVRVVAALHRAQEDLVSFSDNLKDLGEKPVSDKGWSERVAIRNRASRALDNLPWDETDGPSTYDDTVRININMPSPEGGEDRQGYSNDAWNGDPATEGVYKSLDEATTVWFSRLSTAEIKALTIYNRDAKEYAKAMASEEVELEEPFIRNFHSAVMKAPFADKPYRVYAGISAQRVEQIRAMGESGEIALERIQSTSVNPAQVNGFMQLSDPKRDNFKGSNDDTAVEFELTRIPSLSGLNIHRGEMEVLVPPGNFEVTETHHNVSYFWGGEKKADKKIGRTAETTFVVKPKID